MTDNPFATPTAPVQPPAREVPATTQPYAFIAVLALVTCLSFAVSLGIQWYNDIGEIRQRFSEHLQLMAPHWFTGLVFYAAANLLVLHAYREKRQLIEFRPLALLLIGYGLLNLVCGMLAGIGLAPLTLPFYQWVTAQSSYGVWLMAFNEAMSWVYLLLGSLLPLGLVLLGSRVNSPRLAEGEEARVAAWQVALGAALCFATLCFKLMQFLPYALLRYDEPWLYGLYLSGVALPAALLFGAVCAPAGAPATLRRRPRAAARGGRHAALERRAAGGRRGLALLMILGLAPAGIGYTLLVALLGVGLLALLWPIGRLATRWCYADQLAA